MINQTLLLAGDDGYNLTKSLRLRSSASAYLNRTPASAGNRKTWTYSTWLKRGAVGAEGTIISGGATTGRLCVYINSSGQLVSDVGGTGTFDQSTAVYRDPSAWYHFVWQFDTTQATGANRSRMYINGVQVTLTNTRTFTQNADYEINNSVLQTLGTFSNSIGTYSFDGYQTETNFIDGQALAPSSFGETDVLTGVWKPKKYAGTYGTNGFYLPFTDVATTSGSNAGLGKDFSGNGNYWNTNNISVTAGATYDSMSDVPTLSELASNYAVFNPLTSGGSTTSDGNLSATIAPVNGGRVSTIAVTSGKWYCEMVATAIDGYFVIGIGASYSQGWNSPAEANPNSIVWATSGSTGVPVRATGSWTYSSNTISTHYTTNDLVGIALDLNSNTLEFYKNGTSQGSMTINTQGMPVAFLIGNSSGSVNATGYVNFGQRPFSYTPPTGFVALNTFNLPEPSIKQGNKHFDATVYTGNDTTNAIVNSGGFQPDMIWLKNRATGGYDHEVYDSIRGTGDKALVTNGTYAEAVDTGYINLVSFNSNGFTLGATTFTNVINKSGQSHVGWQWKGNGAGSSNTAGSITSTVSANPTAGFSVVTYTGNNTLSTIGHGLGASPKFIIVKTRSGNDNWVCYHGSLGVQYYTLLNTTASSYNNLSDYWSATAPSSSVFGINAYGGVNTNGATYVAYCFAEVAGYSKFGSYTGNGSADGTFVHLGFRPKFVMIKLSSNAGEGWILNDTSRSSYNVCAAQLQANSSGAEVSGDVNTYIDILSNGFKIRTTAGSHNTSGYTYVYAAFAESPFKTSLAR